MCGKTTLAKKLALNARKNGRGVLVYDPIRDPEWQADFITDDMAEFLRLAKMNKNCTLFIDESSTACGQHDREAHWLATQARHWGHQSNFLAQRPNQVAKNIRDNCDKLFCFRISPSDAKLYADEWCYKEILDTPDLPQGECLFLPRFGTATKINVFSS